MDFDIIVRGGTTLTPDGATVADVGISDGLITASSPNLGGTTRRELNAVGLHVLPGGIDAHVHQNEPGRTSWEGFATASTALAVGGMTTFFDMPINSNPPTTTVQAFDAKLKAGLRASCIDFALWGGLVPGNLDQLEGLHQRGVIGFKAFMCETGLTEFRPADDVTLWEGMKRCAELGSIVAVHAENDSITRSLTSRAEAEGRRSVRDYLDSRPEIAETEAIARAIEIASDTGCALHVVHVSTERGIQLVQQARGNGVDVSAETCTHYLALTEDDMIRLGAVAKCSPPMRRPTARERLWEFVASDPEAIVTSDHSPSPWSEKAHDDFFAVWGGMSGCQSTLAVLLNGAAQRGLDIETVVATVSQHVATRFGLSTKGAISPGKDADLAICDLGECWDLRSGELQYRHQQSALVGQPMRGRVRHLFCRGREVVRDGTPLGGSSGQLLAPTRPAEPARPAVRR
jgi:allantoinase